MQAICAEADDVCGLFVIKQRTATTREDDGSGQVCATVHTITAFIVFLIRPTTSKLTDTDIEGTSQFTDSDTEDISQFTDNDTEDISQFTDTEDISQFTDTEGRSTTKIS